MSANNMSDEELDNLFRNSAEKYNPPFDPEAWAAMDRKLDGAEGSFIGIKRFLPALILVLFVSVVFIGKSIKQPESQPKETALAKYNTEGKSSLAYKHIDNKQHEEDTALPEAHLTETPHPTPLVGSGNVSSGSVNVTKLSLTRNTDIMEKLSSVTSAVQFTQGNTAAEVDKDDFNYNYQEVIVAGGETVAGDSSVKTVVTALPDSRQTYDPQERVFLSSITIALLVAPDMTTVRFRNPDAVSANAGLLVSLPLTKRISLVSGAIWANKLYNAAPQDYEPYSGYWGSKSAPDVIAAECKVLDIPVNLQYKVLERNKNVLTVQAGISSYIMLNEKYTYTYKYHGKDPYSKTREFSNENRHWFGVQNIAVGYTRKLSPVLSIGAEPFVKLPLSSIGEGNVKLTSAGVFFTAGFTLQHKN